MTTRVTTMITTTKKTLNEFDSKMQYFVALHVCSCLFSYQKIIICANLIELRILLGNTLVYENIWRTLPEKTHGKPCQSFAFLIKHS